MKVKFVKDHGFMDAGQAKLGRKGDWFEVGDSVAAALIESGVCEAPEKLKAPEPVHVPEPVKEVAKSHKSKYHKPKSEPQEG